MNPDHEARRQRIRELAAEHGVEIVEEHGGYRVRGRRLDVFVLDLRHVTEQEIERDQRSVHDVIFGW